MTVKLCLTLSCPATNFAPELKNFRRNFGLALAVAVAGSWAFGRKIRAILKGKERVRSAVWDLVAQAKALWVEARLPQEIPDSEVAQRLSACRSCPVFFAPLQTCGSPLRGRRASLARVARLYEHDAVIDPVSHRPVFRLTKSPHKPGQLRPVEIQLLSEQDQIGCFCFMPAKSRIKENCWAYDIGLRLIGWGRGLNSWVASLPSSQAPGCKAGEAAAGSEATTEGLP